MTYSSRLLRAGLTGVALLTAAACGSDSSKNPTAPGGSGNLDLTPLMAEISRGTPAAARTEMGPSAMGGATSAVVPTACAYTSASQSFTCPARTFNGITITSSYMLLDAAGHAQSAADVATTAAVRLQSAIKGTLTLPGTGAITGTVAVDRAEDVTLSGLITGIHTLNGTGSGTTESNSTIGGLSLHLTSTETSKTTDVVLAKPGASSQWPLSGNITSDQKIVSSTGSLPAVTSTIHTVMTFDGSAKLTVTIVTGGKSVTCNIDLSNPSPTTCS